MDCTEAFAVPGESHLIDCRHPERGTSWIEGETLEEIRQRYPGAEVVNIEDWCKAKGARQDTPIEWADITEEQYNEALECLPPAAMSAGGFLVGEPSDHHAGTGAPRFAAYFRQGQQFVASSRPLTRKEFAEWALRKFSRAGVQPDPIVAGMVSDASEASERFSADELEEHAQRMRGES